MLKNVQGEDKFHENNNLIDINFLKSNIDFSCLKPDVSQDNISAFCETALSNSVKTIYVPPCFIQFVNSRVSSQGIDVGTTAGFPYGNNSVDVKKAGILYAAEKGAKWVDVCINLSFVKSGRYFDVEREIENLLEISQSAGIGLKLIVESPYLDEDELIRTTKIVNKHKVDYIKTATGVGNAVSEREVRIIKSNLTDTKLKVSGGIFMVDQVLAYFDLGADKIGSSHGFHILESFKQTLTQTS